MTAYFDASRTARDDRSPRNGTPQGLPTEPMAASPTVDLRRFQDAVDALKAELERSGRPDRFVMEKMEQIEHFADKVAPTLDIGSTGSALEPGRTLDPRLEQAIDNSLTLDELLRQICQELRLQLNCDRAAVYRFNADWSGDFVSESVAPGWPVLVGNSFNDTYFSNTQGGRYSTKELYACDDIYQGGLSACHVQLLERFQCRAYLIAPLVQGDRLWGLMALYQNSGARPWTIAERDLMRVLSDRMGRRIAQLEAIDKLQKQVARQRAVAMIVDKIHQFLDLNTIMQTTTDELRILFDCDRSAVYRFNEDWSGDFVSESMDRGWKPLLGKSFRDSYFERTEGGRYIKGETLTVADIQTQDYDPCHLKLLEQFQCRAYIIAPVIANDKLWGLLAVYQNDRVRNWEPEETDLVTQMGQQMGVAVQQAEYLQQLQDQKGQLERNVQQDRALLAVMNKTRESLEIQTLFNTTVQEIRQIFQVDRASVFQFTADQSGEFVAEAVGPGWTPLIETAPARNSGYYDTGNRNGRPHPGAQFQDIYWQDNQGGNYRQGEILMVPDVTRAGFSRSHLELLDRFQAKAYIIVPIFKGNELWGLLAIYQNSDTRQWEELDGQTLARLATQLGLALQQAEYTDQLNRQQRQLERVADRERGILSLVTKVRQSLDLESIFRATTNELRSLVQCDRVGIYAFNEDWSGQFMAESVAPGWRPLIQMDSKLSGLQEASSECNAFQRLRNRGYVVSDTYLQDNQGGAYRDGQVFRVPDIYKKNYPQCYISVLEQMQTKAYLHVPIFKGTDLWGLLAIYQNDGPRDWDELDVQTGLRVAEQLGLALQQAEYIDQLNLQQRQLERVADRERGISSLVTKVRQSLDLESIFRATTSELRSLIQCDRTGIYAFNEDWSGQFMAESVASGWRPLIQMDSKLSGLQEATSECNAFQRLRDRGYVVADTYLQDNQGGTYRDGQVFRVPDIYKKNYPQCYISVLEQMQTKAYLHVPIFKGTDLWGLLAIYQNDGPRDWEELDVQTGLRVAEQLGLAIQQAEILEESRLKSIALEEASQRDKAAREDLQSKALRLLLAVRPALEGDLTVRAPITEDEVGTIADAYNNTLQSLRQIVVQLQETASDVALTSTTSSSAIAELSEQAQLQSQTLAAAVERVQVMAAATTDVTQNAQQVTRAVQQAAATIQQGDAAMNRTVDAILSIRDTVAETGRKIRSLSDSSQKISKIVSLISNFTTQTQLLALNAAIEATRAGEYGRGFTVVADEVRSLARQSADATTEIAALVEEIQAETQAVSQAMEVGIQQVVAGTNLVSDTRSSLSEIVSVTAQIGDLVEGINQTAATQTQQAQAVAHTMTEVAGMADRTSANSVALAASFEALLAISQELQSSVGRFKVN